MTAYFSIYSSSFEFASFSAAAVDFAAAAALAAIVDLANCIDSDGRNLVQDHVSERVLETVTVTT